jgi:diguanylate cyclase (GGDEF)-like protein/PAS domain S-box-containing protein
MAAPRAGKRKVKKNEAEHSQEAISFDSPFDALFERSPVPMWIFDIRTLDFLAANPAACSLYGYAHGELTGKSILEIHPAEDWDAMRRNARLTKTFIAPDKCFTHVKSNGERIQVLIFAQRIRYSDRDCGIVWTIDVSERERASVELKSTQIFLDAVVESIPSMVFVKDARDGRFVLLNKAGEDLLGVSRHDLIGKSDFDLFSEEDARRFRTADQAVVASGELVCIENEPLPTPTGQRSLRTQKIGVPDVDGKPRYLLGISEDVTEKLKAEERSRHLALHDVLTDLPNRLKFQDILEGGMDSDADFILLLLDLDRFKAVNDSLGHHAGDDLLRQSANRMRLVAGPDDIIARLGGDEFAVIHRGDISDISAARLATQLINTLSEPFNVDGDIVSIGCSVGLARKSAHGRTADALMKRADLGLYAAKATGRGDYAWFELAMEETADRQRILRDELSVALEKQQLHLEYQPIVCTKSGRIVCFEALLRWRHPERGPISPAEFIPVAESSGLIEPIGRWVLQQACTDAASWPVDLRVAVNLSPRQFGGFSLVSDVIHALDVSHLAPSRLELEITESIFLNDSAENLRLLGQMKQLGIRIALDDFGTGYSSLAYLRRFPFDKLKIDRAFITDMTTTPENLAIVRAVIGLGKSFGATVTAEGVETEAELACLAREGCEQAQGFLLGRPMMAEAIQFLSGTGFEVRNPIIFKSPYAAKSHRIRSG